MKPWREAASLILAARSGQKCNQNSLSSFNYKILCLKRHRKSKAYPGTYVFPGGKINPGDTNPQWNDLFKSFGLDFQTLFPQTDIRPQLFRKKENELPKEISLRISAIRETFEECGLLICKSAGEHSDWVQHYKAEKSELDEWQKRVHGNADEFYELCKTFNCYPDLWSLHEWSNWLTPISIPQVRFDTVFYVACMPDIPDAVYEISEIEDLKWDTPQGYLDSRPEFLLPPPQQYEFTRMSKIQNIEDLLNRGIRANKSGVHLNFPIKVELKDGLIFVLPGDSMYPNPVRFVDQPSIDKKNMTMEEFNAISSVKNRLVCPDHNISTAIVYDMDSIDKTLSPVDAGNTLSNL